MSSNRYNDPTLPGYDPNRSFGRATGNMSNINTDTSVFPDHQIPEELLGTWSRRSTSVNPPWHAIAYTFFSDGHYQFDSLIQPSYGLEEHRQQIIGTFAVSGSQLFLRPTVMTADGRQTQANLQVERYAWQIDNSLAYGGVVVLKLIGPTEERTFYKNV